MPKDYGDPFPSDSGDSKPSSPTTSFSEVDSRRLGKKSPRLDPINTGFEETLDITETFQQIRHTWEGTIIEYLGDNEYKVMLQDGKPVTATDMYPVPNYEFASAQSVTVLAGQRPDYYYLIGQKFFVGPFIGHCKLNEILEVGGSAEGNLIVADDEYGWDEDPDTQVTVYDLYECNYGLIGELIPYSYNVKTQTAEIAGSQGLWRLGKTLALITAGSYGNFQIHDADGAVADAIVEAHLSWAHSSMDLGSGKEGSIKYFPEFAKWIIMGREC